MPIDDPRSSTSPSAAGRVRLLIDVEVATDHDRTSAARIAHIVRTALEDLSCAVPEVHAVAVSVLGEGRSPAAVRGVFDHRSQDLVVDGVPARLTPRESAVLAHLLCRPHQAVSRDELRAALDDVDGSLGPRAVDVILSRLRAKLPWLPAPVATVRGVGYRYEPSGQFVVLGDPMPR